MACIHRGEPKGFEYLGGERRTIYHCGVGQHQAGEVECNGCPRRSEPLPLRELIEVPEKRYDTPQRIQLGIYSCPRKESTLGKCIASAIAAGFPRESITVFHDGELRGVPTEGLRTCATSWRKFAFPSYAHSLMTMLLSSGRDYDHEPSNDAYILCQDDVEFVKRDVYRFLLDEVLYPCPEAEFGFMSLYCSAWYQRQNERNAESYRWVNEFPRFVRYEGRWVWSGQCILFSRLSAMRFFQSATPKSAFGYYFEEGTGATGLHKLDFVTGEWARQNNLTIWQPSASFCDHIGRWSTIFSEKQTCYGTRGAYRTL